MIKSFISKYLYSLKVYCSGILPYLAPKSYSSNLAQIVTLWLKRLTIAQSSVILSSGSLHSLHKISSNLKRINDISKWQGNLH